ncbi:hypothetical protein BDV59DRAFT_174802 [Aspergillus ambiguus]|uniref:uncharacterized protein n=1 Tax=Aspergillus ambiguus TaxID=176160 RepID=UPI003CCDD7F0
MREAIESEILQLRQELLRVQRRRELLELRYALSEEQKLLEDVRRRLESSVLHTPVSTQPLPIAPAPPVHGIKRSHSEISLQELRAPGPPSNPPTEDRPIVPPKPNSDDDKSKPPGNSTSNLDGLNDDSSPLGSSDSDIDDDSKIYQGSQISTTI